MTGSVLRHGRLVVISAVAAVAGVIVLVAVGSDAAPVGARAGTVSPVPSAARSVGAPVGEEPTEPTRPLVVGTAAASFGTKLVDKDSHTLYVFSLDSPGVSHCDGACAATWPPVRSLGGKPQPGAGVKAPEVGNIQRADGSEQVTFNGHPVYYYSGDAAGQAAGQDRTSFGGHWTAVPPRGAWK